MPLPFLPRPICLPYKPLRPFILVLEPLEGLHGASSEMTGGGRPLRLMASASAPAGTLERWPAERRGIEEHSSLQRAHRYYHRPCRDGFEVAPWG